MLAQQRAVLWCCALPLHVYITLRGSGGGTQLIKSYPDFISWPILSFNKHGQAGSSMWELCRLVHPAAERAIEVLPSISFDCHN